MREKIVNEEIFGLGFSPRHKGFHYLSAAIGRLSTRTGYVSAGETYRMVGMAAREDWRRVERCMRYAIHYAWEVNHGAIRELFPETNTPPAPIEFIQAVLWRIADK
ncbi:MAG: hypothetical protein J5586_08315 [Clostridia bacterium]|nr:hypothetical protein [Clostridia bacterium]